MTGIQRCELTAGWGSTSTTCCRSRIALGQSSRRRGVLRVAGLTRRCGSHNVHHFAKSHNSKPHEKIIIFYRCPLFFHSSWVYTTGMGQILKTRGISHGDSTLRRKRHSPARKPPLRSLQCLRSRCRQVHSSGWGYKPAMLRTEGEDFMGL